MTAAAVVAAVGSALVGGVFFAFSGFVMRALAALPPAAGTSAMQAVNAAAVRPPLMIALFGTALAAVIAGVAAVRGSWSGDAAVVVAAGILYLVGVVGVTAAANVPLNQALDRHGAGTPDGDRFWSTYLRRWTAWNHVRTVASLAASGLFLAALVA